MLSLLSEEIYNRQLYMVSVSIVYCVYDGRSQKKKEKRCGRKQGSYGSLNEMT